MSLESVWAHILTIGQCKCLTICKLVLSIFAVICLLITFTDLKLKLNLLKKTRISRTITGMSTKTETGEVSEVLDTTMLQRYKAAMVLSGVGDAIAFNRGDWEFCQDGTRIHGELFKMGGLKKIDVSENSKKRRRRWIVSDDTVMHLATAEALIQSGQTEDLQEIYYNIGKKYHECMSDMQDRSPGPTCMFGAHQWVDDKTSRTAVKFLPRGGGCGAAMRAMCIGLRYPREEDESMLIKVSVESGRMSHHHPTGYLGALAAALFTAYSVQGKEIEKWGHDLMKVLPKAQEYVKEAGIEVEENMKAWKGEKSFVEYWESYLKERNIFDGKSQPVYPSVFGVKERDNFYQSVSFSGWGGSSGHDAPMIAYDALLAAKDNWKELANRSFFHGGDSDSTAVMAGCWFGALYGLKGVPESNYKGLEYESRLEKAGEELYKTCPVECGCRVCVKLHRGTVTDSLGEEVFDDPVPEMSCVDMNVIYGLLCAKCNKTIYVGETKRTLKVRVEEHLRDVRNQKAVPILRHFEYHSEEDVRVTILQRLYNAGRTYRREQEEIWIRKLKTFVPNGCNVRR